MEKKERIMDEIFDFDDLIQYHVKNLYELFYERKGQQRTYISPRRRRRAKLTPEERKARKRERNRLYRLRKKQEKQEAK